MTRFEDSAEYRFGDVAQCAWARRVVAGGGSVLPIYGMKDVAAETKAPVLFSPAGLKVVPDVLVMRAGTIRWNEVKAKAVPSWRYTHQRWEHGIDYALLTEYAEVEQYTGVPVYLVVFEQRSPADLSTDSVLSGPSLWRWLSLREVRRVGERRHEWPGGKKNPNRRGKRGQGGWLWPVSAMHVMAEAGRRHA